MLYDAGHVSTKEPFQKLFNQGMLLAYSYRDEQGKYYYPDQIERDGDHYKVKDNGVRVDSQIEKLSKSRYNVVNPDDESADRWAHRLVAPQFLDRHELDEGVSLVEMKTPAAWVGRSLAELRPRGELGVHVVAIRRTQAVGDVSRTSLHIPMPDQALEADAVMLLMGSDAALESLSDGA